MILGIGSDLTDIQRIARALSRHGTRFTERCFTVEEKARAGSNPAALARRFAAKEACAKALGTGIAQGVYLRDIGVDNDGAGRPVLSLSGGAAERLRTMTPPGLTPRIHLTLTDEPPLAQAFVVIEAVENHVKYPLAKRDAIG